MTGTQIHKISFNHYMNTNACYFLVYPDQLSTNALRDIDKHTTTLLMVESRTRQRNLPFHKKKLVFEISANRHFAERLRSTGWSVEYVIVDETECEVLERLLSQLPHLSFIVYRPNDWNLQRDLDSLVNRFSDRITVLINPLQLVDTSVYTEKVKSGNYRMEFF